MSLASFCYGNPRPHNAIHNIALEVSNDFAQNTEILQHQKEVEA